MFSFPFRFFVFFLRVHKSVCKKNVIHNKIKIHLNTKKKKKKSLTGGLDECPKYTFFPLPNLKKSCLGVEKASAF